MLCPTQQPVSARPTALALRRPFFLSAHRQQRMLYAVRLVDRSDSSGGTVQATGRPIRIRGTFPDRTVRKTLRALCVCVCVCVCVCTRARLLTDASDALSN